MCVSCCEYRYVCGMTNKAPPSRCLAFAFRAKHTDAMGHRHKKLRGLFLFNPSTFQTHGDVAMSDYMTRARYSSSDLAIRSAMPGLPPCGRILEFRGRQAPFAFNFLKFSVLSSAPMQPEHMRPAHTHTGPERGEASPRHRTQRGGVGRDGAAATQALSPLHVPCNAMASAIIREGGEGMAEEALWWSTRRHTR